MSIINTGNQELDKQVEEWLKWDKVCKVSIEFE